MLQLMGAHQSGELYHVAGSLTPLPKKLKKYLDGIFASSEYLDDIYDGDDDVIMLPNGDAADKLHVIRNLINGNPKYIDKGIQYELKDKTWEHCHPSYEYVLTGLCPGHANHSNVGSEDGTIFINGQNKIVIHCHHNSCDHERWELKQWLYKHTEEVNVVEPEQYRKDFTDEDAEEHSEILPLLTDNQNDLLIKAFTGAGKTYAITKYVVTSEDRIFIIV